MEKLPYFSNQSPGRVENWCFLGKTSSKLQSDIRTFVSLEVADTSYPNPFLSEWNPPFFSIYIYIYILLRKRKAKGKGSPPKQSVAVGILDLDCYERKHNFSLKQNSESFIN